MEFKINRVTKQITFIVCMFIIATSCKRKQNKDKEASLKVIVENSIGKTLILPDSLNLYKPFSNYISDSAEMLNSELKIYSHINASCSTCIPNIKLWDSLVPEFNMYKVPVILICGSDDKFELIKYLCESSQIKSFSYPFFLDKKNKYIKINSFMNESAHFETVLTDKYNTILVLGNPLHSKDIKEVYLKTIIENQKD
ncbi:hypothetical protein [Flavivirga algicola]|uniref:Redoxin domain-containing protein n=1 Tax=Flavivirga algicola TaxID=2729136 RepID=A0ABX1RWQ2_9FLAO|nr:hypothetical protein [Flavivirga algicola]NMH87591.1 hypothetical protein [Flavivirga algicola]